MNHRRVLVIGRGLARTDQEGDVAESFDNGLVGVRFAGSASIEYFTENQLRTVEHVSEATP